jgi:CheY-like chemotaxis protein
MPKVWKAFLDRNPAGDRDAVRAERSEPVTQAKVTAEATQLERLLARGLPHWAADQPLSGGRAHAADGSGGTEPDAQENCVLVVDDESDARDAIVELLEAEGYHAVGSQNGSDALELLRAGLQPAVMLVDLRMPVMDGWAFCAAVRDDERWADIPIAIVTASASLERLPARRRDAGLFIKPVNVSRLLGVVRTFCG